MHQNQKIKCFSSRPAVVFTQYIEAIYYVENEDVVGAALTGDAPTTSEWSAIWLPTKLLLILETGSYKVTVFIEWTLSAWVSVFRVVQT